MLFGIHCNGTAEFRFLLMEITTGSFNALITHDYKISDKVMQTVFMVAEKPSLAESIAKSLSNKRNSSRRDSMEHVLFMNGLVNL
ncbi:unnamed protein product [Heterobilharzia americana]|nr:unnamed protein product [Heterobilharzia americana]